MASLSISTPFNIDLEYGLAPLHKRLFAWIIDVIVQIVYIFIVLKISILSSALEHIDESADLMITLLFFLPLILYHLILELIFKGQSIGKMAMGIRVISANGDNATFSQLFIRWLMRSIDNSFIFVSYLSVYLKNFMFFEALIICASIFSFILLISSAKNQKLGDMAADTVLVLKRMPFRFDETLFKIVDANTYAVTFPEVMRLSDKDLNIVNNILTQNKKSNMADYMNRVADKIKNHLNVQSDLPDQYFLEKLLEDYNYLTQKNA